MIAINLQKPLSSSSSSHSLDSILFFTSIDSIVFKINNIFFLFLNSSTKKKTLFSFLEFYSCLYVLLLFSFFLFFRCWYYLNAQTNTQIRTCIFEIEPIIVRVHRMSFGIKINKHHLKTETKKPKKVWLRIRRKLIKKPLTYQSRKCNQLIRFGWDWHSTFPFSIMKLSIHRPELAIWLNRLPFSFIANKF